jgi:hypothetical protein
MPGSRVHQHRTQAEDVARRSHVVPQSLLGGQEPGRGEVRTGPSGPEADHSRAVLAQQHVRRVEVPVHQPRVMDGSQSFGQPGSQGQHGPGRQRAAGADGLGQRRAGHVRRGQPRRVAVQVRGDHRCGEPPVHLARGGDLGPERRIPGHRGRDRSDHDAFPVGRHAQVQPALAQRLEQLVRPDHARPVRRQRHCHHESPLLVAVRAIHTVVSDYAILRPGYGPVHARAADRRAATARPGRREPRTHAITQASAARAGSPQPVTIPGRSALTLGSFRSHQ